MRFNSKTYQFTLKQTIYLTIKGLTFLKGMHNTAAFHAAYRLKPSYDQKGADQVKYCKKK